MIVLMVDAQTSVSLTVPINEAFSCSLHCHLTAVDGELEQLSSAFSSVNIWEFLSVGTKINRSQEIKQSPADPHRDDSVQTVSSSTTVIISPFPGSFLSTDCVSPL